MHNSWKLPSWQRSDQQYINILACQKVRLRLFRWIIHIMQSPSPMSVLLQLIITLSLITTSLCLVVANARWPFCWHRNATSISSWSDWWCYFSFWRGEEVTFLTEVFLISSLIITAAVCCEGHQSFHISYTTKVDVITGFSFILNFKGDSC